MSVKGSRSSRLGLSDLKNEQATLLHEMELDHGRNFSPSIRDRARAATRAAEAVYGHTAHGGNIDTPVGVAAIQARTSALNAELEFHKDLLTQLLTPPGKPSSRAIQHRNNNNNNNNNRTNNNNNNVVSTPSMSTSSAINTTTSTAAAARRVPKSAKRVPASVRRGTYYGTYTPQDVQQQHTSRDTKTHEDPISSLQQSQSSQPFQPRQHVVISPPSISIRTPSNNNNNNNDNNNNNNQATIGDAYGSLLNELQAVRKEVSRFVETANISPLSHLRDGFERSNAASIAAAGTIRAERMMEHQPQQHHPYDQRDEVESVNSVNSELVNDQDLKERKSARKTRNIAMKRYRARLLEEREKIIDDLEQRVSKKAMRSSRDLLRNSRLQPREVDDLQKMGRSKRRNKQQKIAEECFSEVHAALRNMRDDLELEKRKAETELRTTFNNDRNSMISEMENAVNKEKEEHIKRLISTLSENKRNALEHQRAKLNESLHSEIEEMKMRLHEEHTPALQTFREGHLEKRTEVLAQEELKTRAQLDSEMSILRGKLDAETRKACEIQRMRMIDEHRRRSEDLTQELLHRHEKELRKQRDAMTKVHQMEQETVVKELTEALSFGIRSALEEHTKILRGNTNEKIKRLKIESDHQSSNAIQELTNKLASESDHAVKHLRDASFAELDVQQSRLRGEMAAEHASKVNRLQLDIASKRSSKERDLRMQYEAEYLNKANTMDNNLDSDINDTLEESEIIFTEKLKNDLNARRKKGETKQKVMLIQLEQSFQHELTEMTKMMNKFFGTSNETFEPSSPGSNVKHMPTTKHAIQERLLNMTEQFDVYKNRYKRSAKDLNSLQNEVIDLRQKLRTTLRQLDNAEKRNGRNSWGGGSGSGSKRNMTSSTIPRSNGKSTAAMAASVHDLYQSNQRLIERVTRR